MDGILFGILLAIAMWTIGWLIVKIVNRIWGEYAILKPFDYVEGLIADFKALFEDMPEDWRDLRRWRRESEAFRSETDRKNKAIAEERRRQDLEQRSADGSEPEKPAVRLPDGAH